MNFVSSILQNLDSLLFKINNLIRRYSAILLVIFCWLLLIIFSDISRSLNDIERAIRYTEMPTTIGIEQELNSISHYIRCISDDYC